MKIAYYYYIQFFYGLFKKNQLTNISNQVVTGDFVSKNIGIS